MVSVALPVAAAVAAIGAAAALWTDGEPATVLRLVSSDAAAACLPAVTERPPTRTDLLPTSTDVAVAKTTVVGVGPLPARATTVVGEDIPGPPPRAAATIAVIPARRGIAHATIAGFERDGFPFAPETVVVELSKPAFRLGPYRYTAARLADGRFVVPALDLPKDGFWVLRVEVAVSRSETAVMTDVLAVDG